MRKLIVGLLMMGGLFAVATPAMAQVGDPLTLAASGVLIPFLASNGDVSLLEVASPVGDNTSAHMFFFNAACNRVGDSVGLPSTANDIAFFQVGSSGIPAGNGLIALAGVDATGFALEPLAQPIHARVYIFNSISGRSRVAEPIILDAAEWPGAPHIWSPLRTGATFFAPQETSVVQTRVLLICPLNTIQGAAGDAFPIARFPAISPPFPTQFVLNQLRARIYDTNEILHRDVLTTCACVREDSVSGISSFYAAPEAALGTFTELESNNTIVNGNIAFTGYVAIATVNSAVNNFVHRMSNGNRTSLQGTLTTGR
jgi:hypothetical protein